MSLVIVCAFPVLSLRLKNFGDDGENSPFLLSAICRGFVLNCFAKFYRVFLYPEGSLLKGRVLSILSKRIIQKTGVLRE